MRSENARTLLYFIRCGLSGLLIGAVPCFPPRRPTMKGWHPSMLANSSASRRERALQNQNAPQAARFSRPDVVLPDYPTDEHPCFVINRLTLIGESADRFQWALDAAADAKGRCPAVRALRSSSIRCKTSYWPRAMSLHA